MATPTSFVQQVRSWAERLPFVAESLSWLGAWLVIPAWLAFRGVGWMAFITYAIGAGTLLSLGVLLDRAPGFRDSDHLLWFTAVSGGAVLMIGGGVFAAATALQ